MDNPSLKDIPDYFGIGSPAKEVLERLSSHFSIDYELVPNAYFLPSEAIRWAQEMSYVDGLVAIFDTLDKKVYIVGDHVASPYDACCAFLHEVVGHLGVSSIVSKNAMRNAVEILRGTSRFIETARRYHIDHSLATESEQQVIAEEVIASLAEKGIQSRAVATVREAIKSSIFRITGEAVVLEIDDIDTLIAYSSSHLRGKRSGNILKTDASLLRSTLRQFKDDKECFDRYVNWCEAEHGLEVIKLSNNDDYFLQSFDKFLSLEYGARLGSDEPDFGSMPRRIIQALNGTHDDSRIPSVQEGASRYRAMYIGDNSALEAPSRKSLAYAIKRWKKGFSDEEVLAETGWFRTFSGHYAIEISDAECLFASEIGDKLASIKSNLDARVSSLSTTGPSTSNQATIELLAAEYNEISQAVNARDDSLKHWLVHGDLYKAYPSLGDLKVKPIEAEHEDPYIDFANWSLHLNLSRPLVEQKQAVLHELQHAIQYLEGWDKGCYFSPDALPEWNELPSDVIERNKLLYSAKRQYALYKTSEGEIMASDVVHRMNIPSQARKTISPYVLKSMQGVVGSGRPDNGNTSSMFAGRSSVDADKSLLRQAVDMTEKGAEPEVVWKKTGWLNLFGKWVFEISDDECRLDEAFYSTAKIVKDLGGAVEISGYELITDDGESYNVKILTTKGSIIPLHNLPRSSLYLLLEAGELDETLGQSGNRKVSSKRDVFLLDNALPLSMVFSHPALFSAYPELQKYVLRVDDGKYLPDGYEGLTNINERLITVRFDESTAMLDKIVHEIQHVVQVLEGMPVGGAPLNEKYVIRNEIAKSDNAQLPSQTFYRTSNDREFVSTVQAAAGGTKYALCSDTRNIYRCSSEEYGEIQVDEGFASALIENGFTLVCCDDRTSVRALQLVEEPIFVPFSVRPRKNAPGQHVLHDDLIKQLTRSTNYEHGDRPVVKVTRSTNPGQYVKLSLAHQNGHEILECECTLELGDEGERLLSINPIEWKEPGDNKEFHTIVALLSSLSICAENGCDILSYSSADFPRDFVERLRELAPEIFTTLPNISSAKSALRVSPVVREQFANFSEAASFDSREAYKADRKLLFADKYGVEIRGSHRYRYYLQNLPFSRLDPEYVPPQSCLRELRETIMELAWPNAETSILREDLISSGDHRFFREIINQLPASGTASEYLICVEKLLSQGAVEESTLHWDGLEKWLASQDDNRIPISDIFSVIGDTAIELREIRASGLGRAGKIPAIKLTCTDRIWDEDSRSYTRKYTNSFTEDVFSITIRDGCWWVSGTNSKYGSLSKAESGVRQAIINRHFGFDEDDIHTIYITDPDFEGEEVLVARCAYHIIDVNGETVLEVLDMNTELPSYHPVFTEWPSLVADRLIDQALASGVDNVSWPTADKLYNQPGSERQISSLLVSRHPDDRDTYEAFEVTEEGLKSIFRSPVVRTTLTERLKGPAASGQLTDFLSDPEHADIYISDDIVFISADRDVDAIPQSFMDKLMAFGGSMSTESGRHLVTLSPEFRQNHIKAIGRHQLAASAFRSDPYVPSRNVRKPAGHTTGIAQVLVDALFAKPVGSLGPNSVYTTTDQAVAPLLGDRRALEDQTEEVECILESCGQSKFDAYHFLAGEAMARLTERRRQLDVTMRASTFPKTQLDIPEDKAIVQYSSSEMAMFAGPCSLTVDQKGLSKAKALFDTLPLSGDEQIEWDALSTAPIESLNERDANRVKYLSFRKDQEDQLFELIWESTGFYPEFKTNGEPDRWVYEMDSSRARVPHTISELRSMEFARALDDEEGGNHEFYTRTLEGTVISNRQYTLDELLVWDDLYQAYPQLRTVAVIEHDDIPVPGYFDPSNFSIGYRTGESKESLLRILLHETTHAIQLIEDFPQGSMSGAFFEPSADAIDEHQCLLEIIEAYRQVRRSRSVRGDLKQAVAQLLTSERAKYIHHNYSYPDILTRERFARFDAMPPVQKYHNTLGEVRAREVESRLILGADERRKMPPSRVQSGVHALYDEDPVFIHYSMLPPAVVKRVESQLSGLLAEKDSVEREAICSALHEMDAVRSHQELRYEKNFLQDGQFLTSSIK